MTQGEISGMQGGLSQTSDGDAISNSDPAWVRQMAQTIRWMAYYLIGAIGTGVVAIMVFLVIVMVIAVQGMRNGGGGKPSMEFMKPLILAGSVLNIGVLGLFLVLFERLTRPEPDRVLPPRPVEPWRKLGRVMLWVSLAALAVSLPYQVYATWTMKLDPNNPPAVSVIQVLILVLWFTGFGFVAYIASVIPHDFAQRMGNEGLVKQSRRIVMYSVGNVAVWTLHTVYSLVVMSLEMKGNKESTMLLGICGCPFLLLMVIGIGLQVVETAIGYPKLATLAEEQVAGKV